VVVLVVTYTYDHSSSNDQIASFMVPLRFKAPKYFGGSTEPALLVAEFWVPEPSTVTLKHSAVILHFADFSTPSGYNLRAGSGSYTTYTLGTVNANTAGTQCLVHRVDSGGIGGLTLARGRVELTVNEYHGTAAHWSAGYLLVNYTHGKHASGSGVCNHTIKRLARGDAIQAAAVSISSQAEAIPEAAYWVNGYGLRLAYSQQSSVVVQGLLEAQRTTGDVPDVGAEMLLFTSRIGGGNTASDFAISEFVTAPAVAFNRFASDDEHLLDVERARTWRFYNPATTAINLQLETWLTYHAITFSKTSAITGSGGGTVNWRLCYNGASSYLLAPGEKVASGTRSGNGNVSLTWYDDTESMFVEAYEDSTHVGRSFNFTMA
jgi:hypothetical protein